MSNIPTTGAWLVTGSAGPGGIELRTVDGDEIVYDLKDGGWYVGMAYGQGAGTDWIGPLADLDEVLAYLGRP
jgi:hypothetical protein